MNKCFKVDHGMVGIELSFGREREGEGEGERELGGGSRLLVPRISPLLVFSASDDNQPQPSSSFSSSFQLAPMLEYGRIRRQCILYVTVLLGVNGFRIASLR